MRLVLATSLDGRLALPAGGPAQLGGEGDRAVLEDALAWADACLMGAGTLRAHRCTCLIRNPGLRRARAAAGRPEQPAALVVSSSVAPEFAATWPFFQQPLERWLLHSAPLSETVSTPPKGFDRALELQTSWHQTFGLLASHGMGRLVLLGGAALAASCLKEDAVDELQLTITPRVVGGRHGWVPFDEEALPAALGASDAWALQEALPLQGNELMLRYQRRLGSSS